MVDRMSNIYWLSGTQMDRLRPYFPKIRGRVRVDDRRVLRGIIFINRNGFRWCDAPSEYGPPKTLYNRWKRWSDMGVFSRIIMELAEQAPDNKTISIDATYLKAHCTASGLGLKNKGAWASDRTDQRWDEYKTTRSYRRQWTSCPLLHHCGSRQQLYRRSCIDERPTRGGLVTCRQGIDADWF